MSGTSDQWIRQILEVWSVLWSTRHKSRQIVASNLHGCKNSILYRSKKQNFFHTYQKMIFARGFAIKQSRNFLKCIACGLNGDRGIASLRRSEGQIRISGVEIWGLYQNAKSSGDKIWNWGVKVVTGERGFMLPILQHPCTEQIRACTFLFQCFQKAITS